MSDEIKLLKNDKDFLEKILILLNFGKSNILPSNEDLDKLKKFDYHLMIKLSDDFKPWNDNWEYFFPDKEKKINLLKGLILLERINSFGFGTVHGSVATNIIVFNEIRNLKLDTPELLDWIFKNKSNNSYTPFGEIKYGGIKNYEEYISFLELKSERQKVHSKEKDAKKIRLIEIQKNHEKLMANRDKKNKEKRKIVKDYFADENDFLNDILIDKLPFPINLSPKKKLNNIQDNLKSMSKEDLRKLKKRIPKKTSNKLYQIKIDIKKIFKKNLLKVTTDNDKKEIKRSVIRLKLKNE